MFILVHFRLRYEALFGQIELMKKKQDLWAKIYEFYACPSCSDFPFLAVFCLPGSSWCSSFYGMMPSRTNLTAGIPSSKVKYSKLSSTDDGYIDLQVPKWARKPLSAISVGRIPRRRAISAPCCYDLFCVICFILSFHNLHTQGVENHQQM